MKGERKEVGFGLSVFQQKDSEKSVHLSRSKKKGAQSYLHSEIGLKSLVVGVVIVCAFRTTRGRAQEGISGRDRRYIYIASDLPVIRGNHDSRP